MKDLKFIQACPDDDYFTWQVHTWLESLRKLGHSDKAISLIFTPKQREKNPKWQQIVDLYPESTFFFYKAEEDLNSLINVYIPIIRPYILSKYFKLHPELKEKAIFYCDADVIFTSNFNINSYLDDDICYVSDTNSYINASYFDSKEKDVISSKLEDYKKRDVLDGATKLVGINREIAEKNNLNSGGAQYLLKNIDVSFWEKVLKDCISIRMYLQNVNKFYFKDENKGFQSWAADMWAVLWNLWKNHQETKIIPEMEFAWSSDSISKLEKVGILHNAGITSDLQGETPVFYKGRYHQGRDPFEDAYFIKVTKQEKTLCNHAYIESMMDVKNKYKLKY